jgi:hypothetical protein
LDDISFKYNDMLSINLEVCADDPCIDLSTIIPSGYIISPNPHVSGTNFCPSVGMGIYTIEYCNPVDLGTCNCGTMTINVSQDQWPKLAADSVSNIKDEQGNVIIHSDTEDAYYVAGWYNGTIEFDNDATNQFTALNDGGNGNDIFVVKYHECGQILWSMTYSNSSPSFLATQSMKPTDLLLHNSKLYVSANRVNSSGLNKGFILALNPSDGNIDMSSFNPIIFGRAQASGESAVNRMDIVNDPLQGEMLTVTGGIKGRWIADPQFPAAMSSNLATWDIMTSVIDLSGTAIWIKTFGEEFDDEGYGITTNSDGTIYITGMITNANAPFIFGGSSITKPTNSGLKEVFVASYRYNGIENWAVINGASANDWGKDIVTISGTNFLALTGVSQRNLTGPTSISIGNLTGVNYTFIPENKGYDMFVALINRNNGNAQSVRNFGNSNLSTDGNNIFPHEVTYDPVNIKLGISGSYSGIFEADCHTIQSLLVKDYNPFMMRLSMTNNPTCSLTGTIASPNMIETDWIAHLKSTINIDSKDYGFGHCFDANGLYYFTGSFEDEIVLEPSSFPTFSPVNQVDYFAARVDNLGILKSSPVIFLNNIGSLDELDNVEISVYPNPAHDEISIKLVESGGIINIANISGQIVYSQRIEANNADVNTNRFDSGMYIIAHTTKTKTYYVKFIKD